MTEPATPHRILDLCIWAFSAVVVIGGWALAGLALYLLWKLVAA